MLVRKKHSSLLDTFKSYEKMKFFEYAPCTIKLLTAVFFPYRKVFCLSLEQECFYRETEAFTQTDGIISIVRRTIITDRQESLCR
jgi:hypothetical protein